MSCHESIELPEHPDRKTTEKTTKDIPPYLSTSSSIQSPQVHPSTPVKSQRPKACPRYIVFSVELFVLNDVSNISVSVLIHSFISIRHGGRICP
jgi:hypothetical protein